METSIAMANLISVGLELIFYITLLIFTIVATMLAYHWFVYGTKRSIAMLSLALYLAGSAPLFIIMSLTF